MAPIPPLSVSPPPTPFLDPVPEWAKDYPSPLPSPDPIHQDPYSAKIYYTKFLEKFGGDCIDSDRLEPIEELGSGGFSVVERCVLKQEGGSEEEVACKRLKGSLFSSQTDVATFFAETDLLRKLSHPNIVQFKGVCVGAPGAPDEGSVCLVQEFLNHGTLKSLVHEQYLRPTNQIYTKREALKWMLQVARGLAYLHGLNVTVIHRDLKIENILLHRDKKTGEVVAKIADFGLSAMVTKPKVKVAKTGSFARVDSAIQLPGNKSFARKLSGGFRRVGSNLMKRMSALSMVDLLEDVDESDNIDTGVLATSLSKELRTNSNHVHNLSGRTGSLLYMAPEVLHCNKYNEKVDVFSFAVCMYEALCGCWLLLKLFQNSNQPASDAEQYAQKVGEGHRQPLSAFWPEELKSLVQECWAQDPSDRPTMKSVVQRLERMYNTGMFADEEIEYMPKTCTCCTIQ